MGKDSNNCCKSCSWKNSVLVFFMVLFFALSIGIPFGTVRVNDDFFGSPTVTPTKYPTNNPTKAPTKNPTKAPTATPTAAPTP